MNEQMALKIANLQDCWSMLYITLAREMIDAAPVAGESAVREAVRQYGRERGEKLKKRHLDQGLKINLENLFTYYDLPGDPRFERRKIRLNPQERLSDTLVCPIAQLWKDFDEMSAGRIYCEEFHHAMFGAYANKAQINLSKTLTQEGDDYCCFAVYLRPANMDPAERKISFSEFDPNYSFPEPFLYEEGTHREGFHMLCIKLGYCMVKQSLEQLGDRGREAAVSGLRACAESFTVFLKEKSQEMRQSLSQLFVYDNLPFSICMTDDVLWKELDNRQVKDLFETEFYIPLRQKIEPFL